MSQNYLEKGQIKTGSLQYQRPPTSLWAGGILPLLCKCCNTYIPGLKVESKNLTFMTDNGGKHGGHVVLYLAEGRGRRGIFSSGHYEIPAR